MSESSREMKNDEGLRGNKKSRVLGWSLWRIMKHSDRFDVLLMTLGTIGCVVDGSSLAMTMLVVSKIMNGYSLTSLTKQDINEFAILLLYIAFGVGFGGFLEGFCWARTAERQASRLRYKYLQAVLRQDVGFFDTTAETSMTSKVVSSISTETLSIQGLLSEKLPNFIMNMSMFIVSQLAALYLCWRLAIVAIPALSMLIIPGMIYGKLLTSLGKMIHIAYGRAGGVVEQALSSIRIVYAYVGEERTVKAFSTELKPTVKLGIRQGLLKGLTIGSIGAAYAIWALQGWYGSILVIQHQVKGGEIFSTGTCIVYGGFALMGALANVRYFIEANIAAASISEMIERVPIIDSSGEEGQTIAEVNGELVFKDIDFAYHSRPESLVLRKFNLRVPACQTVGLVGESGTGKSTIINLLERFYDPLSGEILLDGINIKSLQLKWLRSQTGLVDQEPVLFATSIKENILFGKEEASEEEIVRAAIAANAHDFITKLPNGYDTLVGQLGTQMSGGQKQRISIARALLRNPKILLLDEATSSLDSQSEMAVQEALSTASLGRTTITIAHRLSTLRNADMIAVVQSGQVLESGSHDELMKNRNGPYSAMVMMQGTSKGDEITSLPSNGIENENPPSLDQEAVKKAEVAIQHPSSPKIKAQSFGKLTLLIRSEWKAALIGCVGALSYGAIQPLHSYCMGALLSVYFSDDKDEINSKTKIYCSAFLTFSFAAFITSVIQHYHFAVVGENLTKKFREQMLSKIMTFEIEWFDQENNSSGAICARFATDGAMIRTLVADRLSLLAQAISGITLAILMGMVLAWRLAIVIIGVQPLIIGGLYLRVAMMKTMSKKVLKAQNKSSELASEAVGNHRIINAYYSQKKVMELFEIMQIGPKKESHKQSWYAGMGLFTSGFLNASSASMIYWYGGRLLYQENLTYKHLFQIFFILVSTGRIIAEAGSTSSDLLKGVNALKSVFMIFQRQSKMSPDEPDSINPNTIKGDIELKEVEFFYPTRPKQIVLKGLNLKAEAGQVVALVGHSGSGKSTIIRLIERFYDPSMGSVRVDGIDIKRYNLRGLRSHIALVSQEPTLFAESIYNNIAYAKENASEAEIIEAATLANAHDFISSMKEGYATYCGEKGLQLSGGQKQRIALARAILKNPSILLLDEATSALDIESERMVQDALEKIMIGRTCLVVAHRLSTVKKANRISVIDHGRIVEEGSHSELLTKGEKGMYYSFVKLQHHDTVK